MILEQQEGFVVALLVALDGLQELVAHKRDLLAPCQHLMAPETFFFRFTETNLLCDGLNLAAFSKGLFVIDGIDSLQTHLLGIDDNGTRGLSIGGRGIHGHTLGTQLKPTALSKCLFLTLMGLIGIKLTINGTNCYCLRVDDDFTVSGILGLGNLAIAIYFHILYLGSVNLHILSQQGDLTVGGELLVFVLAILDFLINRGDGNGLRTDGERALDRTLGRL